MERSLCRGLRFGREGRDGVDLRPWRAYSGVWGSFAELRVEVQRQGRGLMRNRYEYMENNDRTE